MYNKKLLRFAALSLCCVLLGSAAMAANPKKYITSNITTNTTWDRDTTYVLGGFVYVTNNAVLTIESGTVVFGYDGTLFSKGALIVTKGSQLIAQGCPASPIIFTSGLKTKTRGDWGGVILLGKATINQPGGIAFIEGITPSSLTEYGGGLTPDDNDNSGIMQYVRIEYAGVALSPNNEINGLTFGGVGRGTTIDHIMVSYSNDDSYEWFGGTVDAKYLIAFRGIDDDFDTDNGYSGRLQFGIGLRDKAVADISGSKAFESDNDANASNNTPQTKPTFMNFTCTAGGDTVTNSLYTAGAHIRRWSHMNLYNSIVMGYPQGFLIDANSKPSPNTFDNVINDDMVFNNIVAVWDTANKAYVTAGPSGNTTVINRLSANNFKYKNNAQGVRLQKPWTVTTTVSPDFRPKRGATAATTSPALTKPRFANPDPSFFETVKFIGAMDDTLAHDWTKGSLAGKWVNWKPDTVGKAGPGYTIAQGGACSPSPAKFVKSTPSVSAAFIKVSPNPTNGSFSVEVKGFASAQVTLVIADVNTGNVYYTSRVNNNAVNRVTVNVPNGYYIVKLTDGKSMASAKINVVH